MQPQESQETAKEQENKAMNAAADFTGQNNEEEQQPKEHPPAEVTSHTSSSSFEASTDGSDADVAPEPLVDIPNRKKMIDSAYSRSDTDLSMSDFASQMEEGMSQEKEENLKKKKGEEPTKQRFWIPLAILVALALVIVVPVVWFLTGNKSNDSPKPSDITGHLVPGLSNFTLHNLQNNRYSSQRRAYDWIANDPHWDSYPVWRKQQRFALAALTFSYATGFPVSLSLHECHWRYRRQIALCNSEGQVIGISWTQMRWTEMDYYQSKFVPPEVGYLLPQLRSLDFSDSTFRVGSHDDGNYGRTILEELLPSLGSNYSAMEGDGVPFFPSLKVLKTPRCLGLEGTLPSTLGLLTSLTWLDLSFNQFDGPIPSELAQIPKLHVARLQSNYLSGTIPNALGELERLNVFNVEDNDLEEFVLPEGFCRRPMAELATDWCWEHDRCCD